MTTRILSLLAIGVVSIGMVSGCAPAAPTRPPAEDLVQEYLDDIAVGNIISARTLDSNASVDLVDGRQREPARS